MSADTPERNVKLTLEYDGTNLSGWQRQANAPTVQQHVEDALSHMTGAPVVVTGASRTDAGVHARGQVCNFRTRSPIPIRGFLCGLTPWLPAAIAVVDASDVPASFHARRSARGKHYRYTVLTRPQRSPLRRRVVWQRPRPLDVTTMRAAASHLIGEHDFEAFRAAGCSARHAVRRISSIEIHEREDDTVVIDVHGNAFVRNMVRIIAGTLVEVGEHRRDPDDLPGILASRDRRRAGQTAPARGLCLVRVLYDDLDRP